MHEIVQGEGGEQGDPVMPALFALGQHAALVAVQDTLLRTEKLFAFLDDIYAVAKPERVAQVHATLERELWAHARIHIHQGKTQFWNQVSVEPLDCQRICAAARAFDSSNRGPLFRASTRGNYVLRVVHPELSHGFAARHDSRVWSTLTRLLEKEGSECAGQRAALPFSMGGLGFRSAVRTSTVFVG